LVDARAVILAAGTTGTRVVSDAMLTGIAGSVAQTVDVHVAVTRDGVGIARESVNIIAFATIVLCGVANGPVDMLRAPMTRGVVIVLLGARALPIHRGTLVGGIGAVAIDTRPVEPAAVTHLAPLPIRAVAGTEAAVPLGHVGASRISTNPGIRMAAPADRVINDLTSQLEGQNTTAQRQGTAGRIDRAAAHPHDVGIVTADLGCPCNGDPRSVEVVRPGII
jgi:hypothetical protein